MAFPTFFFMEFCRCKLSINSSKNRRFLLYEIHQNYIFGILKMTKNQNIVEVRNISLENVFIKPKPPI